MTMLVVMVVTSLTMWVVMAVMLSLTLGVVALSSSSLRVMVVALLTLVVMAVSEVTQGKPRTNHHTRGL